jgi:predicted nuclease of predicted toxin-antitoxin system
MSRQFLVDANLPIALARMLSELGHPSHHVHDVGLSSASDQDIWRAAEERGAVIISKDVDFAERVRSGTEGPSVVGVRIGNVRREDLLARLRDEINAIRDLLDRGERLIELR